MLTWKLTFYRIVDIKKDEGRIQKERLKRSGVKLFKNTGMLGVQAREEPGATLSLIDLMNIVRL